MRWTRRAAAFGCVALSATVLVAPPAVVSAQARGNYYGGTVDNPFPDATGTFNSNVELSISNDGAFVTGRAFASWEGSVQFLGRTASTCLSLEVSFLSTPLPVRDGRATGDVTFVQTLADGTCSDPTNLASQELSVPFEIEFSADSDQATGQTTFEIAPGSRFRFTATLRGRPGGGGDDGTSTTTTTAGGGIPGIEELFAGSGITADTRRRLAELQGCRARNAAGECALALDDRPLVEDLIVNARDRFGFDVALARDSLGAAAWIAALRDADGRPLVPGMQRMLPVIIELRRQAEKRDDSDAELAARRLIGFLVTHAIQARE